jgi:hypothetical protein
MESGSRQPQESLDSFIGEWSMEALFAGTPRSDVLGRTTFEWLAGGRFLVQRWEVPHPAAPDGIAIIGFNERRGRYLQHYFDSRGVARVYEMSFGDRVWELSRTAEDFSALDFSQRFTGTFSDDGQTIDGRWETSADGTSWSEDFKLIYTRVGPAGRSIPLP